MLKEMFEVCELNYPVGKCFLDCMIITEDGTKIDIEYDGAYWHQDKSADRARDEFMKTQGYKILRIRGGREIPEKNEMKKVIQDLCGTQRTFACINMV